MKPKFNKASESSKLHIAIDGNEANVTNRVGSNVYAFELISHLEKITRNNNSLKFTILLGNQKIKDLPAQRENWQYLVIKPKKFWTRWAEPLHLFAKRNEYDLLFVAGHYGPAVSPVPYVSCVMDLAYLYYPDQFRKRDLFQLKSWTKKSVKHAARIIAISQFTKHEIHHNYGQPLDRITVAYPDANLSDKSVPEIRKRVFFKKHNIQQPYFLFLGTLQPRKNLVTLVKSFEKLCQQKIQQQQELPQLVIAGKIGWLADEIQQAAVQSKYKDRIILTGYVSNQIKQTLIQNATATILIGLYEGFGIPPLESLKLGTVPIVSNCSSLPEVVGEAGFKVDPENPDQIAQAMGKVLSMTARQKAIFHKKAREQTSKFSWEQSAERVLDTLKKVAQEQ